MSNCPICKVASDRTVVEGGVSHAHATARAVAETGWRAKRVVVVSADNAAYFSGHKSVAAIG